MPAKPIPDGYRSVIPYLIVADGAALRRPVEDQFYGDRLGSIVDPFGHLWHISTHVEDVSPGEIAQRAAALAQDRGE